MIRSEKMTRRRVIQGGAGLAAAGTMGFPGILKAQDVLKFGHLTPLTGFSRASWRICPDGRRFALEEVNGAGGVMGRKVELVMEDRSTRRPTLLKRPNASSSATRSPA
jgi:branched-chain amino acid transport system substrate-binding protein